MKKILVLLMIAAVAIGCQTKLEKARINMIDTWKISKVFENGDDVTTAFTTNFGNYQISFDGEGNFTETFNPFSGNLPVTVLGTWVFSDGIKKFTLRDNNQSRVFQIDELSEANLNITDLGASNNTQLLLVPE